MGTGYLVVQARTGDDSLPVRNAHVTLFDGEHTPLYETFTDAGGNTDKLSLPAPDKENTLNPATFSSAYSKWNVDIEAEGFVRIHIHGVEIVDTQISILPVQMLPLSDEPAPVTDVDVDIPPLDINKTERNMQSVPPPNLLNPAGVNVLAAYSAPDPVSTRAGAFRDVVIPDYITVHLGTPTNSAARNVRVKFTDYIKNVASADVCQGVFSR